MAFYHTICFVFTVLIICNAVLYPSIFSSVFKKWFSGSDTNEPTKEKLPDMPPHLGNGPRTSGAARRMEMEQATQRMKNVDPASYFTQQKQEASKGRGLLGSVLPVYAVGIVVYFAYIMYRIFLKDRGKTNDTSPSGSSPWDANHEGATLQRVQQEKIHRQLSEQLRADNYMYATGGDKGAKKAGKPDKPRRHAAKKHADPSEEKSDEVAALKKRLEDTERSMHRMMEMMNTMGIAMSQVTEQLTGAVPTDLANSISNPVQQPEEEASDEEAQRSSSEDDIDSNLDSEEDEIVEEEDLIEHDQLKPNEEGSFDPDDIGYYDNEVDPVEVIGGVGMEHSDAVRRRVVSAVGGES